MANFRISHSTIGEKRASMLPAMANRRRSADGMSRDRIGMLPDELLVSMLSRLTFEEAIATSLLSRRWRCLWKSVNMLDFDGTNLLLLLKNRLLDGDEGSEIDGERMKYIRWVNRVMALIKSPIIEKFRVFLDLRKRDSGWIDEWLRFALARDVQRLELNLTNDAALRIRDEDEELYTFPYHMLRLDSIDFKSLRTVSLNNVNVDGETLQFLCTCPLLEDLSVSGSLDLLTLKVVASFPPFKRLEISMCPNLTSVEIRDANLVYLKYRGKIIDFVLENVPLLVDLCVEVDSHRTVGNILSPFSTILPQLRICRLAMLSGDLSWEVTRVFYSFVQMRKLEKLAVRVGLYSSLQPFTDLLLVSRRLQRFVVELWRVAPISPYKARCGWMDYEKEARRVAEMQLRNIVPPTIKLEIIDVM